MGKGEIVPMGLNYPLRRIRGDIGNPGRLTGMSEEGICRYGLIPL